MNKYLLILILTALITLPACAELTVNDTVDEEYLLNHGYSKATVRAVEKSRAQINGEPLPEKVEKEYYNQPVVKYVRRFLMYIDPALDDHSYMNDHSMNTSPRYDDL